MKGRFLREELSRGSQLILRCVVTAAQTSICHLALCCKYLLRSQGAERTLGENAAAIIMTCIHFVLICGLSFRSASDVAFKAAFYPQTAEKNPEMHCDFRRMFFFLPLLQTRCCNYCRHRHPRSAAKVLENSLQMVPSLCSFTIREPPASSQLNPANLTRQKHSQSLSPSQ